METSTLCAVDPLDAAEAIVEAEWIRLHAEAAPRRKQRGCEHPAPAPNGVHTEEHTRSWPPDRPLPRDGSVRFAGRWLAMPVWATQRSPPREAQDDVTEMDCRTKEVIFNR
jgi:hypothetical protein